MRIQPIVNPKCETPACTRPGGYLLGDTKGVRFLCQPCYQYAINLEDEAHEAPKDT